MCNANVVLGLSNYLNYPYHPSFIIFSFFITTWIAEAIRIKDKLNEAPQKALYVSLLVNLATTLLGFLITSIIVNLNLTQENFMYYISRSFLIILSPFIFTVLVETLLLILIYKNRSLYQIIFLGLSMNLISYFILFYFIFYNHTLHKFSYFSSILFNKSL